MAVDGERLLHRLSELARIGADPRGGVTRLAYTPADAEARALVGSWLTEAGATVRTDAAGNLIGELPGTEDLPWLATGSHLDTVVQAGPLDGAYGAVAAVEVLAALRGRLRHPLRVVGFSNEEGAHGTPGMVGSSAIAGRALALGAHDDDGQTLAVRLLDGGGDPDSIADAGWRPGEVSAFLELHIEQGPVLQDAGIDLGVVTAITGRASIDVELQGRPAHAGTTPMELRHDALVAASVMVLAIEALALDGHVRVATAGRLDVEPGVRNVVPARATISAELRDVDDARMHAALVMLQETAAEITDCTVTVHSGAVISAVRTDPDLQQCLIDAAVELGATWQEMPSGAGHDSQIVADVAPVGLVFVPSAGGISHAPDETTADLDLVRGADLLLEALLLADARLDHLESV